MSSEYSQATPDGSQSREKDPKKKKRPTSAMTGAQTGKLARSVPVGRCAANSPDFGRDSGAATERVVGGSTTGREDAGVPWPSDVAADGQEGQADCLRRYEVSFSSESAATKTHAAAPSDPEGTIEGCVPATAEVVTFRPPLCNPFSMPLPLSPVKDGLRHKTGVLSQRTACCWSSRSTEAERERHIDAHREKGEARRRTKDQQNVVCSCQVPRSSAAAQKVFSKCSWPLKRVIVLLRGSKEKRVKVTECDKEGTRREGEGKTRLECSSFPRSCKRARLRLRIEPRSRVPTGAQPVWLESTRLSPCSTFPNRQAPLAQRQRYSTGTPASQPAAVSECEQFQPARYVSALLGSWPLFRFDLLCSQIDGESKSVRS